MAIAGASTGHGLGAGEAAAPGGQLLRAERTTQQISVFSLAG